ncbi:hypothetical protein BS333_14595 [Vibrio azureus]|uniref:BspA family leucine-rich repeat surface protein n=1 Tax=Vibrio azureus NBRC 104587 TaxID=1219077 RepID=U3CHN2_9VIBR|nr:BspA family leucine-rich repeat surface protein [Vibrio azureus]AUI87636.1 hypothetical protein BS333_14595 [Vibrio azureus]GAD77753.1 hypothetical protein VAZ01S_088_00200 [Vibrio azureus NBRC 104587]
MKLRKLALLTFLLSPSYCFANEKDFTVMVWEECISNEFIEFIALDEVLGESPTKDKMREYFNSLEYIPTVSEIYNALIEGTNHRASMAAASMGASCGSELESSATHAESGSSAKSSSQESFYAVNCENHFVGDQFQYSGHRYLVVDDVTIRDSNNLSLLEQETLRFCTSQVTNMRTLFKGMKTFNADIRDWDVSNVVDMDRMFSYAKNFQQDISHWDTSSVRNMKGMFFGAAKFRQDLTLWEVNKVCQYDGFASYSGMTSLGYPNFNYSCDSQ